MTVDDLAKQLAEMQALGRGDWDVVHVMGNGAEKVICGFETVERGYFSVGPTMDEREKLTSAIERQRRERPRLRLFTTSPF